MPEPFDPYYTWLGIPPQEQPADHYRLLGINRFEENREVISHASDQRMTHVRAFQNGRSARESQRVLNELSKAAGCLLNPRRKAMYDQHLQSSNVTSKKEESRLPPSENLAPAIKVQVGKSLREAAASKHPSSFALGHKLSWIVGGAIMLVFLGLTAAWWSSAGSQVSQQPDLSTQPRRGTKEVAASRPDPDSADLESLNAPPAIKPASTPAAAKSSAKPATKTSSAPLDKSRDVSWERQLQAAAAAASKPPASNPRNPGTSKVPSEGLRGLHFGGKDRIELANSIGLIDLQQPFTVELWVRFEPKNGAHWIAGDMIIGPSHPEVPVKVVAGWQLFIQQTENDQHRVAFATGEGYASDFPAVSNAWHHIAACSDSQRLAVFVDGRRRASGLLPRLQKAFVPSPLPIHIGSHGFLHANQPPGFTGDLGGFRISSVCRYSASFEPVIVLPKDANTQLLLDFDHSTGAQVKDLSGHGRDGTIVGAQWIDVKTPSTSAVAATTPPPAAPSTAAPPTAGKSTTSSPTTPMNRAISPTPATSPSSPVVPASELTSTEPVRPTPDEVALATARDQVRKVLEQEFKQAKEPKLQLALADRLMGLAEQSNDDLAGRYVMLEEAHKLALQAGDLPKSLSIIDDFGRRFAIDSPRLKAAAIAKAAETMKTAADRRRLAETAIGLLDELILAGAFDAATDVTQVALSSSARAKDAELGKVAREYRDEIAQAKKHLNAAREAEKKLAVASDDAESQLRWGKFVCFHQRNWPAGLPHLALGSHPRLAAAAKQDQSLPATAEQMVAMGKTWTELVKVVEPVERSAVALRAVYWLRQAESQLKGLAQADVAKQIKELEADLPARLRLAAAKAAKQAGSPTFQPPPEFVGMPGRIQVNGVDVGVLWKYEAGLRLTNANLVSVLTQAKIPLGKLRIEFLGLIYLPESMTVNVAQASGSATGIATLVVDNKPLGEVGGKRATSDIYKVDLNAGEHSVRWTLTAEDPGTSSLTFSNAATAKPLVLYHNPALMTLVRDNPTRARLNVNMSRN